MRGLARKRILTVEVTVAASSSYVGFLEAYAQALVTADTPAGRLRRWAGELLQAVSPEVRFDARPAGDARFTLAFPGVRTARETARLATRCSRSPAASPRRAASDWRSRSTSSRPSPRSTAATSSTRCARPCRTSARSATSSPAPSRRSWSACSSRGARSTRPARWCAWKRSTRRVRRVHRDAALRRAALRPEAGLGEAIVELAGNVPYDVQRLAHETWDDVKAGGAKDGRPGRPASHAWPAARRAAHGLRGVMAALDAPATRGAARPRARSGRELLSADVRTRHRLPGASSVQSALAALVRQDIVMKEGDATPSTIRLSRVGGTADVLVAEPGRGTKVPRYMFHAVRTPVLT